MENMMDMAHLPIVHGGLLGDPVKAEIGEYMVTTTAEGFLRATFRFGSPIPRARVAPPQFTIRSGSIVH